MPELTGLDIQLRPKLPVSSGVELRIVPGSPIITGVEIRILNEENIEGNFQLTVKDKTGAPLAGVIVKWTGNDGEKSLVTDANGYVEIRLLTDKEYEMKITKDGKQYYKDIFYVNTEQDGILRWEISLATMQPIFITHEPGKALHNVDPSNPENNILIE